MELERRLADVQADRSGRRLPERVHGQRGNGLGDPDQRRRRDFRRAESREHHRRLPPQPRGDQGVPAQGRRRGAQDSAAAAILASASSSSPTASFSMDGDLGPLPALCALAEEFGCIMMVDDAHASGVFGRNGRGTIDHFDVHGRVDIQVGTLSKAIGALGGYVAGSRAPDRVSLPPRAAVPVFDLASASRGRRRASRRSTCCSRSRTSSSGCGTTRGSSRPGSLGSASTPASARVRSRRSSSATARWR